MYAERLNTTLIDLLRIPSTSGHEERIREHLARELAALGLSSQVDAAGNLLARLGGEGRPILLNAHMDRVPPGLGHEPVMRDGVLYSDGTTNLGADDAAGIALILEIVRRGSEQGLPRPPLALVFTVQEEAGMCGASGFDGTAMGVADGIVFDNAYEAGVVVGRGAAYEAFDVRISGRPGHPGKDLARTVNAIELFRAARYPHGSLANDQTRINIGYIAGGSTRNAVAESVLVQGELRSFEAPERRRGYRQAIQEAFEQAARISGGRAEVSFATHSAGYALDADEPLLRTYGEALAARGAELQLKPTFIGSDTSGFRPAVKAFTLSTGVVNEHSVDEYVALAPLEQVVADVLETLSLWSSRTR
jgi:tripeptide aminopeptidase